MIKFEDFFIVENPEKTKVKFNMNAGNRNLPALDYLRKDNNKWIEMNAHKRKQPNNNLNKAQYLLSFAQYYPYGPNYYIFGGMYKIEKILPEVFDGPGYKLTLLEKFKEYRKRLIIKLGQPIGRDIYTRNYRSVQEKLNPEIYELSPSTKLGDFPGYNGICLSHNELQDIINQDAPEWKNALSNVKGVYCITDKSNGKLYIGSASGNSEGIWQRWKSYANINNLTGGNKDFDEIVKKYGINYIVNNFSYSILEIFDTKTEREYIIKREEFWKKVFQTTKYGMNNSSKK